VSSLRDSLYSPTLPPHCVPGYHMPPLSGLSFVDFVLPLEPKFSSYTDSEGLLFLGCLSMLLSAGGFRRAGAWGWEGQNPQPMVEATAEQIPPVSLRSRVGMT
jgi:hypothetical protein